MKISLKLTIFIIKIIKKIIDDCIFNFDRVFLLCWNQINNHTKRKLNLLFKKTPI